MSFILAMNFPQQLLLVQIVHPVQDHLFVLVVDNHNKIDVFNVELFPLTFEVEGVKFVVGLKLSLEGNLRQDLVVGGMKVEVILLNWQFGSYHQA